MSYFGDRQNMQCITFLEHWFKKRYTISGFSLGDRTTAAENAILLVG